MVYAGIDLHRRFSHVAVVDQEGELLKSERVENNTEEFLEFFEGLDSLDSSVEAVIEATGNWFWILDLLEEKDIETTLAHPLKTKAIASAKIKTDSIDAETLAQLLRTNLVPESYVATQKERELRDLLRYRWSLVRERTLLKNKIHSILAKFNLGLDFEGTDLFGKKGREYLTNNALPNLKPLYQEIVQEYLSLIDEYKKRIKRADVQIKEEAEVDHQTQLLLSIPGVGYQTALLLSVEIGDFTRFSSAEQVVGYVGLAPSTYASAGKTRHGRITKLGNPYVRWALVQTAHRIVRADPYLKEFFERIAQRRGRKKAKVAVARKVLVSAYYMIERNQKYIMRSQTRSEG